MPKLDHQVNELLNAFKDTIDIERTKARLDVITIISDGMDHPTKTWKDIIEELITWAKN